ncbi:MAG TPA: pitrilysin family protein, partial [Chroococcales cyanobacterium]
VAMANRLEEMGTSLDYTPELYYTVFSTEVTSEDTPKMLELIADSLKNPLFSDTELKTEKKQLRTTLNERLAEASSQAWNAYARALYKPGTSHYSKPFADQLSELDRIDSDDLKRYHHDHFTPDNTVIAIVGDIDPEAAVTLVQKNFSDWSGSDKEKITVGKNDLAAFDPTHAEIQIPLKDKVNTEVVLGHAIDLDVHSPDFFAAKVGNAALGYDTVDGRLSVVRDQHGWTYNISSSLSDDFYPYSPWNVSFSVNPENYRKALALVRKIIDKYSKEGITKYELEQERSRLSGAFYVNLRSPRQVADKISLVESLGLGVQFIDQFGEKMEKVTAPAVNSAIKKYLNPAGIVTVSSGTFKPGGRREDVK